MKLKAFNPDEIFVILKIKKTSQKPLCKRYFTSSARTKNGANRKYDIFEDQKVGVTRYASSMSFPRKNTTC